MRSRTLRVFHAGLLATSLLALAACGQGADTNQVEATQAAAEATANPTEWAEQPSGAAVDVNLPETPMTNAPVDGAQPTAGGTAPAPAAPATKAP